MKKVTTVLWMGLLACLSANSASASRRWSDYTPTSVQVIQRSVTGDIILKTRGMVDSCARPLEGNRYRAEVISCDENSLHVRMENRNRAECQQASLVSERFRVNVPRDCDFVWGADATIVINEREFSFRPTEE